MLAAPATGLAGRPYPRSYSPQVSAHCVGFTLSLSPTSRNQDTANSEPPPISGLYQEHKRLLSSRAQPPSLTRFISQATHPQPFLGTEQERPR